MGVPFARRLSPAWLSGSHKAGVKRKEEDKHHVFHRSGGKGGRGLERILIVSLLIVNLSVNFDFDFQGLELSRSGRLTATGTLELTWCAACGTLFCIDGSNSERSRTGHTLGPLPPPRVLMRKSGRDIGGASLMRGRINANEGHQGQGANLGRSLSGGCSCLSRSSKRPLKITLQQAVVAVGRSVTAGCSDQRTRTRAEPIWSHIFNLSYPSPWVVTVLALNHSLPRP